MPIFSTAKRFAGSLLISALLIGAPALCRADFSLSIHIGPPALPVYVQPPCPTEGYLWTPGYWAYGPAGYYWVPGVWVAPPAVGVLWTPGYWGFTNGAYLWHAGYWGPHVGFYGGINYGFGFTGVGFVGGGWFGGHYRYNTAVTNVNTTVVRNVYVDRTVVSNTTVINNNRASFNGPGGIAARPNAQEQSFAREQHIQPTAVQQSHQQTASQDREQFASFNQGHPATASMASVNGQRFNPQARMATPGQRSFDQQQRVAQGVRTGQLTPGQTGRIETREQNINNQAAAERRANGGALNPNQRQQVNREQNRTSREIHNDRVEGARREEHK